MFTWLFRLVVSSALLAGALWLIRAALNGKASRISRLAELQEMEAM